MLVKPGGRSRMRILAECRELLKAAENLVSFRIYAIAIFNKETAFSAAF